MSPDFEPLERVVGRELSKLDGLKAPPGFSRRVRAAIEARAALPWWQQNVWCWPSTARTAFLFTAVLLFLLAASGTWLATQEVTSSWNVVSQKFSAFSALWTAVVTVVGWVGTFLQRVVQPWLTWIIALIGLAYLLCMGLGTALFRFVLRPS